MIYDFKKKQNNINQLNDYMLSKTLSMFEYENLPVSIPRKELEYLLQTVGYAFITEVDGKLYALTGSLGGEVDAYNRPTTITVNNVFLKFNKTLSLKDDGVLICNDDMLIGLLPLYEKHNTLLVENDINMVLHGYNTRIKTLISASDDKTKASADSYLKKVIDGEVGIVAENALFDGVRVQGSNAGGTSSVTNMTEYHQYVKASLYNEIGLSANFNMKRERLTSGEVSQGEDSLFPYVYNMMDCRLSAVKLINEKYDTDIKIDFGSVWHLKDLQLVDNIVSHETQPTVNEPSNEPSNEPLTDSSDPLKTPLNEGIENEQIPVVEVSDGDSGADFEKAKTVDELMDLLKDENLTDDDINAIDELIKEIEDK